MANHRVPGPVCSTRGFGVDAGTRCLGESARPSSVGIHSHVDRQFVEVVTQARVEQFRRDPFSLRSVSTLIRALAIYVKEDTTPPADRSAAVLRNISLAIGYGPGLGFNTTKRLAGDDIPASSITTEMVTNVLAVGGVALRAMMMCRAVAAESAGFRAWLARRDWEDAMRRAGHAEYTSFMREFPGTQAEGDLVRLGEHAARTRNRDALGMTGSQVESAHVAPQSVMKQVAGYNPEAALASLLKKSDHRGAQGMDHFWKLEFDRLRRARPNKKASAKEIYNILTSAIKKTRGLPEGERKSLIRRLHDEMFVERGLRPETELTIPRGYVR